MALANVSDRAVRIQKGGEKRFSKTVDSGITAPDKAGKVGLYIKWNPDWEEGLNAGVKAEQATVEVDATNIILRVDGALDRNIAYAGLTPQELADAVEEPQNGARRWRAGFSDREPVEFAALQVQAETNAMVGYEDEGVPINDGSAFFMLIGVGASGSNKGTGARLPQMFNTDYVYARGGLVSPTQVGRGGGIAADQGEDVLPQKASRYGTNLRALAKESNPANLNFDVFVDSISHNLVAGANELLRIQIFEDDPSAAGNVPIWQTLQADTVQEIPVPNVRCRNSAFLQIFGVGFGSITGKCTMRGIVRAA